MDATAPSLSARDELPNTIPPLRASPIAAHWPTLAGAISRYQRTTAESFSRAAYETIDAGMIRHDERRRLADLAESLDIRPFDAQLLIACAVRQWALDRQYDPSPAPRAPMLSFEYQSWRRAWARAGIFFFIAGALDVLILWKWLF